MECLRCQKTTGTPDEEQKLPICSGCRKDFHDTNKLVDFLNGLPKDHPERDYVIGSQIANRQSYMSSCKQKSIIREKMNIEIEILQRIYDGIPMNSQDIMNTSLDPITVIASDGERIEINPAPIQVVATP